MKHSEIFKEARRLYKLGFAIHWLHPKSKRPIESGWGSGPRKAWSYLETTYIDGLNVGVRLGAASPIAGGFLAVVDVDVKSKDPKHRAEALTAAKALLGDTVAPMVRSGRGGGSRHYYCLTAKPFKTWNPAASKDLVKVMMPSKRPSKRELTELTADEIGKGIRLSLAWEVSLYSDGRQVVLPPSVHPDSGELYTWARHLNAVADLPLIVFPEASETAKPEKSEGSLAVPVDMVGFEFKAVQVDVDWLPINDQIKEGIKHATSVTDRSGFLLRASNALLSAGLDQNEILSVLTDHGNVISACCYEHAKTSSRTRAAQWLFKYTFGKVKTERSAAGVFTSPPVAGRSLTAEEIEADELEYRDPDWRRGLIRTGAKGDGPVKCCVTNIVLILEKMVGEKIFERNLFAYRDTYGLDTPWGGKANHILTDDDVVKIKYWLGRMYGIEPKNQVIEDAMIIIANKNAYDPVKDNIEALPAWDGVKRIDTWLVKNFAARGSAAYNGEIFRKWLVAMVMRVYEPGSKFDWMPVFEGPQGVGKSSFGKILAGGEKYFIDSLPNFHDKDAALALQGIWVVENGELAALKKNDIEIVKSFTSRMVDKLRPPYGRKMIESPRRCVFFGTTNRNQYLIDDTGNRRFKPLLVGHLNFKALKADRDQLLAEAKHLYDNKIETVRSLDTLSPEAAEYEKTIHQNKMIEDDSSVMKDMIFDFLKKPEIPPSFNPKKFKLYELFSEWGPLRKYQVNKRNEMFAAKAVKLLGAEKIERNDTNYWKIVKIGVHHPPGVHRSFSEENQSF